MKVEDVPVKWAARQYVLAGKGVSLTYNVEKHLLSVQCVWKGVHKDPEQSDPSVWSEGYVYSRDGSTLY